MEKIEAVKKLDLVALVCVFALFACAHSPGRETNPKGVTGNSLFEGVIDFYTGPLNHLKAVRRGVCSMYPSCSEYSRQAIARHGFARGWVMTMDRLMRCGRDETRLAPKILINGNWNYYDPVESNDIWRRFSQ